MVHDNRVKILTGNNWLAIKGLARVAHTQAKIADWVQTCGEISNVKLVCAAIGAGLLLSTAPTLAQTDPTFEIQTSQPDLEQEYRDELDKWMLRAYEGDRDAQFKVGVLFTNDQFGPPDYEQAVYWYKQAARQGHVLAQYNLGHQYLTGIGVAKSDESAMQWWLEAAKQDHALAQFNVGRAFYLGIGLPEDHVRSKYWFERAASNQEPKSIDILRQLGWWDGQLATSDSEPAGTDNQPVIDNAGPVDAAGQDIEEDDSALTSKIVPIETNTASSEPQVTDTSEINGGENSSAAAPVTVEDLPASAANTATQSAPVAVQQQAQPQQPAVTPEPQKNPIALYTNPAVRSVLIAILDERDTLTELERRGDWATVQSNVGFPVWVHGDFLSVRGEIGTVNGEAVNARSVPIITNGTVVGKLNKDESVAILDQRKNWYRVVAPARFKAWAKVSDMDRTPLTSPATASPAVAGNTTSSAPQSPPSEASAAEEDTQSVAQATESTTTDDSTTETEATPPAGTLGMINDNDWLFGQPADHYTLQLASFDDLTKVEEFVSRAKFRDNPDLHRFTAKGKNIEWTYFLYGSFDDRSAAESAKVQINQKLAWVRTFGRLQQNRCVSWKTKLPTPKELNRYCTQ